MQGNVLILSPPNKSKWWFHNNNKTSDNNNNNNGRQSGAPIELWDTCRKLCSSPLPPSLHQSLSFAERCQPVWLTTVSIWNCHLNFNRLSSHKANKAVVVSFALTWKYQVHCLKQLPLERQQLQSRAVNVAQWSPLFKFELQQFVSVNTFIPLNTFAKNYMEFKLRFLLN